ncbi:MAG: hypothetical protein J6D03_00375 [Clostridia bacterium]|nr:hypothetical protein [Clostridia bacterium]
MKEDKIKTIQYDVPYTYENSDNPWLMESKNSDIPDKKILNIDGNDITATYMWSLNVEQRNELLNKVYEHYRNEGFPYETYDDKFLIDNFNKLIKADETKVLTKDGFISNFGQLCLPVCRHFCYDKFWKASSESMMSIEDVFNNDELFIKTLKNRMGWNVSKEGGEVRPYMFTLNNAMIRCGIRNSGQGYGVSNFRPIIAKFIYKRYLKDIDNPTIYDFSAGWGARCLAAMACGYKYIGVDPLTSKNINEMINFYNIDGSYVCYNMCSQDNRLMYMLPENIDLAFSCPPYFNLEVYSKDNRQSYNEFDNYEEWIDKYWKPTVEICHSKLAIGGKFVFIIKDKYGKLELKKYMEDTILNQGFEFVEQFQYKTSVNHLSGKVKTHRNIKNNEYILTYAKLH